MVVALSRSVQRAHRGVGVVRVRLGLGLDLMSKEDDGVVMNNNEYGQEHYILLAQRVEAGAGAGERAT